MTVTPKIVSAAALLLAFSSVLSATPRLGLSSIAVGPINIQTGANGSVQTIQAYNYGDGTLSLTTGSSAAWLTATVGAQTACSQASGGCYPIAIALNTASLAAGVYTEYITVNAAGAIDAPQTIAVTVSTTGVPSSLTAYLTPPGGGAATTTFPVYALGTGLQATVTTSNGGNWLQFINTANSIVPASQPYIIQVSALAAMPAGTYTGTVAISGSSVSTDNKTVAVTAIVTSSPIISLTDNANLTVGGYVGGPVQLALVNLVNESSSAALSVTGATGSASWLTASVNGNLLSISATPGTLTAGLYKGTVTLSSNAANNSQIAIPVEFTVGAAGTPSISIGGIVNEVDYTQTSLAPGDVIAVFGQQFAPVGTNALNASTPLATTLGSAQVLVNGSAVPLYYVGASQINFQLPYGLTGGQVVSIQVIANGQQSNLRSVTIATTASRLLFFQQYITGNYGLVVNNLDGSFPLPTGSNIPGAVSHPAKPGDILTIYGVGFGQTSPAATAGLAATSSPLQNVSQVTVSFGGGFSSTPIAVTPLFAGLTPTAVGLYQVNVAVPANATMGLGVPLAISVNGQASNTIYVAISPNGQ